MPNYQELDVGRVQVGMMKLKLDFLNGKILKLYEHLMDMRTYSYFVLFAQSLARIPYSLIGSGKELYEF